MYLFVIILGINCVSAQPAMSPAPVAEVEENGNIALTCSQLMTENLWLSFNIPSAISFLKDCTYHVTGNFTSDMEFTCPEGRKSVLTLSRVSRDRHGQIWNCQGPHYAMSYSTVVFVKGLAHAETCSQDTEIEVCPYPVAYFVENQSLNISARYTGSHIIESIKWNEYDRNSVIKSHLVYPNCSYGNGNIPDGYEFVCDSFQALFTMIIKNVRFYMHGQMLMVEFKVPPVSTISKYIILSFAAKEDTSTVITTTLRAVTVSNGTTPQTPSTTRRTATVEPSTFTMSQRTTTTISSPSPTRVPSYEPNPAEYEIQMMFSVKVEMEFNEKYQNKLSPEYQSLARNFSESLMDIYKNLMGFRSIELLQFSPSIFAEYSVNFYANIDVGRVTEEIKTKVIHSIKTITGVPVDTEYTIRAMTEMLDLILQRERCSLVSKNLCPFGYYCKPSAGTTLLCMDRCNSTICQNNGECYIGHHDSDVQCRCPFSSDVVYSGSRCEMLQEVILPGQKVNYIIIGSCLILGIVIISVVIIIILKRQLIRHKETFLKEQKREDVALKTRNDIHAVNDKHIIDTSAGRQSGSEVHLNHMGDIYCDSGYRNLTPQNQREESAYDYIDPQHRVLSEPNQI